MDRRPKQKAAPGADVVASVTEAAGREQTENGAFLSTPIVAQKPLGFKTQNGGEPLSDALERELAAFWAAHDRHDYSQADQHAARYRELVHGQREIDARLARLEREAERQAAALDALERSLDALEIDCRQGDSNDD